MAVMLVVLMAVEAVAAVVKATTNINILPSTFRVNNSSNHLLSLSKVNPNLTNKHVMSTLVIWNTLKMLILSMKK
eukprot:2096749-Ditylum_brightwellii.AAC.1